MKLKYYLRGLGTGILFATLILFISYTYHNTDAQVKKRAKALGMVETTVSTSALDYETTSVTKDTSVDETTDGTKDTSVDETTSASEDTTVNETTKGEQHTTDTIQNTTASDETTSTIKNINTEYEFNIVSGMSSQQVASMLQNIGAVDDAVAFDSYLVQNGYADRIKVGNFKISSGASYADIAILITN